MSKIIRVHDKQILITDETIKITIDWYIKNAIGCIREAQSGLVFVNDLKDYKAKKIAQIREYKSGNFYKGLWFWSKAYYLQTKKSVSMLGGF